MFPQLIKKKYCLDSWGERSGGDPYEATLNIDLCNLLRESSSMAPAAGYEEMDNKAEESPQQREVSLVAWSSPGGP